ncbi:hypothetical protein ABVT39_011411 [Epinephelus coioides]
MSSKVQDRHVFKLQLDIDGLPLFKSSSVQFWPNLGMLQCVKRPVLIALFCGVSKPTSLPEYLRALVNELKQLKDGFLIGAKTFFVKVSSVVRDAPARSYIKAIKSHTGYSGYDKCIQSGLYMNHPLLHDLLVKQEIIIEQQQQQQNIIRMVQDLHAAMHIMTKGSTTMERHHSYFPLCNIEELMALEGDLKSLPGLKKELVTSLGLAGGATMKDTVRGILKRAMRNDLALKVTWSGVNGKLAFERLHLKAVVVATDNEIAKAIKKWFYWAGDRDGGRRKHQYLARTKPGPSQNPARFCL